MRPDGFDAITLAGLIVFTIGLGMISLPLGLAAAGLALMAFGVLGAKGKTG